MKSKIYTKKSIKTKKYKSTKKSSHDNSINILSYNVSWESMTGNVNTWALCSNNTNKNNSKHYSVCVNNIANVINEYEESESSHSGTESESSHSGNRLDFITLQEATNYQKLIEQSPLLQKMKYETHISDLDQIVTFWNPKYKLLYSIKGEFEKGRPWMATLFTSGLHNSKICLINLHMGHYDHHKVYSHIEKMIFKVKEEIIKKDKDMNMNMNKNMSMNKNMGMNMNMNMIRYIVSGDFNYNIKDFGNKNNTIIINGTRFYYHPKKILTCCIQRRRHYDHVIDSFNKPIDITIPKVSYMASDHKPIIVKLVA